MKNFCFHLNNLSSKKLCNLLLFFCSVPHAIVSVLVGYSLSFIPKEVEALRSSMTPPTAVIEYQSTLLWLLFTAIIFFWGFMILKLLCECIYRLLSHHQNG